MSPFSALQAVEPEVRMRMCPFLTLDSHCSSKRLGAVNFELTHGVESPGGGIGTAIS